MRGSIGRGWTLAATIGLAAVAGIAPAQDELIIRGGRLFDSVSDELRANTGIVIRGGKFFEVDADLSGRDLSEATVVELDDDDTIMPGVFDLHAHYNVTMVRTGRRDETNVMPVLYLANGATSTFPAGEYNPEPMLDLRRRVDRGESIGPRIYSTGPYYGTARRGYPSDAPREWVYAEVDKWAELGARGFKAKGIRPNHLKWLIERAHLHGLTVTAHLDSGSGTSVNPRDAILMGIDRVEHFLGGDVTPPVRSAYASLQNFDPVAGAAELDAIIDLYIEHGVTFDATITAYGYQSAATDGFDHWIDEQKFLTPYVRETMAAQAEARRTGQAQGRGQRRGGRGARRGGGGGRRGGGGGRAQRSGPSQFDRILAVKMKTIKRYYDRGGRISLGTDHPSTGQFLAGFSWHREIDAFVRAGIPEAAALKIATINGARALNVADKLGTIEAGKFADLLVMKGDPLANIRATRTVHTVVKSGRVYETAALLASVEGKLGPKFEGDTDW